MKEPLLSIVIPVYNEEENIERCINSLMIQTYLNFEIIIVDDGSTDKTQEIVRSFKKVTLLIGEHRGPGFSRNLGAKRSRGEILIFVDADMTFDKEYLEELIKPIIESKCIGTEDGKQIASNPENIWSRCWGTYFKEYINPERGQIFRAILRREFIKMGGFDSSLGYADDLTFYLKYGITSIRVPNAICYHANPATLKEVYKQSRWIGASLPLTYKILKERGVNYGLLLGAYLFSPIIYPGVTFWRMLKKRDWKLFFPYWPFIAARYFGTLNGLYNQIVRGINTR